jgi:ribonuclease-3
MAKEVKAKREVAKKNPLETLQKKIGYRFKRKDLLEAALTHRSMQQRGEKKDYERLEYLGDAVLDLAIAHLLLDQYPDHKEGDLSKMRAALVNTQNLASIALSLDLSQYVRVSKSEESTGGKERPSLLADVVEALFGAIYRDGGYNEAKEVIDTIFYERIRDVSPTDPKTELQEVLHALGMSAPVYTLDKVEGPEHAPTFVSSVLIEEEIFGTGKGATKKSSQAEAASFALTYLKKMSAKKDI